MSRVGTPMSVLPDSTKRHTQVVRWMGIFIPSSAACPHELGHPSRAGGANTPHYGKLSFYAPPARLPTEEPL
jgi:hypothetical protein